LTASAPEPTLRLRDRQLDMVMAAAEPLPPDDRSSFLEAVAAALRDREIGDGTIGRAIREVQKRTSKWR
jgi:DNA-directed RNA polymerase specialized sigma24 family protein